MTTDELAPHYREAIAAYDPVIDTLLAHYKGFERQDVASEHLPQHQLEQFLSRLDIIYPSASVQKLKIAIRHFITDLECFRYRVVARDGANHNVATWDALVEPLEQFLQRNRGQRVFCRPQSEAYPSTDLILDWINSRVSLFSDMQPG